VNVGAGGGWWWRASIRTRLAIVLAIALAPVLLLSAVQSVLIFKREVSDQSAELRAAAERGATLMSTRIVLAGMALRQLAPASAGPGCASRLAEIKERIPGYLNVVRLDASGAVVCAAVPTASDPHLLDRPWFRAAAAGSSMTVGADRGGLATAGRTALVVSVPAAATDKRPAGVLSAVISIRRLSADTAEPYAPTGTEVALVDRGGQLLTSTRPAAFAVGPGAAVNLQDRQGAAVWSASDKSGARRQIAAAPVAGGDLHLVLSAPRRDVAAWVWLNAATAVGLPLLAFGLALGGVWVVADRGVVRWVGYLQRVAAIYAHGRYGVHPLRAEQGPPEIRELAETLDAMATVIASRDRSLRESLEGKDDLLREIHHRVKNNLQVISSLLNMQQRALTDPAARAAISDTRQRITALALIYRALYEGPDLRKVDLRLFLEDLIAQLVLNDTGSRSNIATELTIDALTIDPDHLAPLALFAVEAITNAKKHGISETGGRLVVTFRVRGDQAELAITDSGRAGAPTPVVGDGVGRTLMLAFARQLGGDACFRAQPGGGMTARLSFPTPTATRST
jgi:two-component sensor histidine kinase